MQEIEMVTDNELILKIKNTTHSEREIQAEFLTYLSEIDRRHLYAEQGYSSLFRFVVGELHYSEGSALKRIQVARCARKFPVLYSKLREQKNSLTVLSKLAPHLNIENVDGLLKETERKSVAEVEAIIASHFPDAKAIEQKDSIRSISEDKIEIKFVANKKLREKIEKAKALLSHRLPKGRLEDIFEFALDQLIGKIEPKKEVSQIKAVTTSQSRHIPGFIQREVWHRDEAKCSYKNPEGKPCQETKFLNFDHVYPWGWGGKHESGNVRLLCHEHNQMMARKYFMKSRVGNFTKNRGLNSSPPIKA